MPEASLYDLDHFEVQWGRNTSTNKRKTTKKCYAWFKELETITCYLFKVRAVRKNGCVSEFREVSAETNSITGKVAKVVGAGVAAGAVVGAAEIFLPISMAVLIGRSAGKVAAESVEDKGKSAKVAAGSAAGIAGGIAGFIGGILAAPIGIVVSPFAAVALGSAAAFLEADDGLDVYLEKYPDDDNT